MTPNSLCSPCFFIYPSPSSTEILTYMAIFGTGSRAGNPMPAGRYAKERDGLWDEGLDVKPHDEGEKPMHETDGDRRLFDRRLLDRRLLDARVAEDRRLRERRLDKRRADTNRQS